MKVKSFGICPYRYDKGYVEILVCKSSRNSCYGFIKGKQEFGEKNKETAIREFKEEAGVELKEKLEKKFCQKNKNKDICIYLADLSFKKYNFKINKKELYSIEWKCLDEKIDFCKNQKEIYNEIINYLSEKNFWLIHILKQGR